jgi:DNA mismatch repair protein MutS2
MRKLEFEKVVARVARYALSEPGRDRVLSMTVSTNFSAISAELSLVTEMKRLLEQEEDLPLSGVYEIAGTLKQASIEGAYLSSKQLIQVAATARASRLVRSHIAKRQQTYPLLWDLAQTLHSDKVLEYNIEQAVDESGALKAKASRELESIRRSINDKYDQLRRRLEGILRSFSDMGFSQEDIITTREGRMVIPVKAEHKNRVQGFIHSASASGATVFIEPSETLELNNDIRSLQFQEQREVERILRALTQQVQESRDALLVSLGTLARLDAFHAKAKYSIEILGTQPKLKTEGALKLLNARHPILLLSHGLDGTIPLTIELGADYNTLVISGPNAGGKSVALKCVGLLVLMAQAGLHIPADTQSVIPVVGKVFVDIGDEQSIENDLSTFSSHLQNLKSICEHADSDTLVLIDEIGSGTDPSEGGVIAASVLESLTKRGALTIATTHHGALKVFAYETDGIENGAMEFDQATLQPTYRFKAGVPGSSYALEMASRLGLDDRLLNRARQLLGQEQTKLQHLISELESSAQQYKRDLEDLTMEKNRLDLMVTEYESKLAMQTKELKSVKRNAILEARRIVEQANALIEKSIKDIRESKGDKETVRRVREEVGKLADELASADRHLGPAPDAVEAQVVGVGSRVTIGASSEVGEVESVDRAKNTAVVALGSIRMRVALGDLHTTNQPQRVLSHGALATVQHGDRFLDGLDLRGMTGEEAIPLIDKFIDSALLAGLQRVDIIHGKGTGALRKRVAEFLSVHPHVRSFHLAEWNEGGTGATVVELET